MATAVRGRGPVFDTRPAEENGANGPLRGIFGVCKDTAQGACAGLLSLLGASHIMGASSSVASVSGVQSFSGLLEQVASGGLAGPVELLGATVLFFTARRTIARTIGLLLFIGFMTAYANGYSMPEMLTALSELLKGAAGVLDAIPLREGS